MRALSYNGINFQAQNVHATEFSWEDTALFVQSEDSMIGDARVVDMRTQKRDANMRVVFSAQTSAELDALIDATKKAIVGVRAELLIEYNGAMRAYPAVCTGIAPQRGGRDITMVDAIVGFTILGNAHDAEATITSFNGNTDDISVTIVTRGTAAPVPRITITIKSVTNGTQITIGNVAQSLTITHAFVANDVIVIDAETMEVSVDGLPVDYVGVIPDWTIGNNTLTVDVTAAAMVYDVIVTHKNQYL